MQSHALNVKRKNLKTSEKTVKLCSTKNYNDYCCLVSVGESQLFGLQLKKNLAVLK